MAKKTTEKVSKKPLPKAKEELQKLRSEAVKKFTKEVVDRYGKHIMSIVLFGSSARGDFTKKSDIDVVVIVDDTSMQFDEALKGKFDEKLFGVADLVSKEFKVEFSVQPGWLLTEFEEMIRNNSPLVMTFLRDGLPVYDPVRVFQIKRNLLNMGMYPATKEAVERRMETVPKRLKRAEHAKLYMVAEDCYYAMLDSSQAVMMYMGHFPPTSKECAAELRRVLVGEKLLDEKFVQYFEDVYEFRKKTEHREIKEITGQEVDAYIKKGWEFVEAMEKVLSILQQEKKLQQIAKTHEVMIKAAAAALKSVDKLPEKPEDLPKSFKKYFIDAGKLNEGYMTIWDRLDKMHKMVQAKELHKIPERDVYETREDVRRLLRELKRILEDQERAQGKISEHKELVLEDDKPKEAKSDNKKKK